MAVRGADLFLLLYASLLSLTNVSLLLLGESRFDLYILLSITTYYIAYAIAMPEMMRRGHIRTLNKAFFTAFLAVTIFRIYVLIFGGG